ncbi:MAG: recombination regulator RecX [Actinomycetota bacterium]|nr:recombination regulator RecX [Actinomycetota bacterium]
MSTEDGRFVDGPDGPVRVADFDALDDPDDPDDAGPAVRVASFELDDDDTADDGDGAGEGPGGRAATAGAPTPGIRDVELDGVPNAEEPPGARIASFDDGLDGAGPDGTTREARFEGTLAPGRRGGRGGAARRDGGDGPRRGRSGRRGVGADGSGSGRRGNPDGRDGNRTDAGPPPDNETRAKEICLRLLTDRARTVKELRDALLRKDVPEDVADRVLERFDEVGLVDDEAFAGQWVRSRHHHRGLGRRAIAQELRRKGVAKEVADEALTEIDAESEEARARELVDKKIRTVKVGTREERAAASRRLVGMLARKGYGAGVAYTVVREAIAARGAEEDELGEAPAED